MDGPPRASPLAVAWCGGPQAAQLASRSQDEIAAHKCHASLKKFAKFSCRLPLAYRGHLPIALLPNGSHPSFCCLHEALASRLVSLPAADLFKLWREAMQRIARGTREISHRIWKLSCRSSNASADNARSTTSLGSRSWNEDPPERESPPPARWFTASYFTRKRRAPPSSWATTSTVIPPHESVAQDARDTTSPPIFS